MLYSLFFFQKFDLCVTNICKLIILHKLLSVYRHLCNSKKLSPKFTDHLITEKILFFFSCSQIKNGKSLSSTFPLFCKVMGSPVLSWGRIQSSMWRYGISCSYELYDCWMLLCTRSVRKRNWEFWMLSDTLLLILFILLWRKYSYGVLESGAVRIPSPLL